MAIKTCEDCGKDVSTAAPTCPHCGRPQTVSDIAPTTNDDIARSKPPITDPRSPIFTVIAGVVLLLSLGVPRILLIMPVLVTVVCGVVALARKERYRGWSVAAIVLAGILFIANAADLSSSMPSANSPFGTANLDKAKVVDFNWHADPTFGTRGTIKWNVSVQNLSDRPISMVGVQFTTYDRGHKLIATTTSYVNAVPPGETRSNDSFADLYGNEDSATATIASVMFADR